MENNGLDAHNMGESWKEWKKCSQLNSNTTKSVRLDNWFFSTLLVKRVSEMARKTMNARSKWKNGLFERPNGLTSCRFFHEWNEWKNLQRVRPFGLEKRPFFHEDLAFIVLSANSITSISNNVEHECLRFSLEYESIATLKGFFTLAFKRL